MTEHDFVRAYEAYADVLFRHCYFRVSERERAKDIVQEAFVKTWDYLQKGNEIENIRAFLYRVADNLIIDESRKKKSLSLDELHEVGFDPKSDSEIRIRASAEVDELIRTLDGLPAQDRELIVFRHVDGFGPKEIAEILGTSENAVSVRLHRALGRLRAILNQEFPHIQNHRAEQARNRNQGTNYA